MQRCQACNRQFGLVRHRWWGYQFCKKKCLNDFLVKRSQQIGHMTGWLRSLIHGSRAQFSERIVEG